jgi:spore coat polysaccharide biosynthesis predicted glycosyltransferase SpsG
MNSPTPSSHPLLRILFVCRGSSRDGLGHIMRSRTVAVRMSRSTAVRMLVLGDDYVDGLLVQRGIRYAISASESAVTELLQTYRPHVVIFDALRMSAATIAAARQTAMVVSLSPVFNHLADMDLVFHRTTYRGDDWDFAEESGPESRCSLDYAVVRNHCVKICADEFRRNLAQERLAVAISMGGADAGNKTLQMLQALAHVPRPLLIWAMLGEGYEHSYEALTDCVRQSTQHEIILAKTNASMWRVLRTCCLAVLSGGTVTYEAAYAGLPSINLFESRKHVFLIRELVERGVCLSAGYPLEEAVNVAAANVVHLETARAELIGMHRAADGIIDGKADARIAEEIISCYWQRSGATPPVFAFADRGAQAG